MTGQLDVTWSLRTHHLRPFRPLLGCLERQPCWIGCFVVISNVNSHLLGSWHFEVATEVRSLLAGDMRLMCSQTYVLLMQLPIAVKMRE